ncbi:MAG: CIA30 family protein [Elusimicrobia bacterium]|nr:CIA30 family protein [Elusimicrobiota bacterium]
MIKLSILLMILITACNSKNVKLSPTNNLTDSIVKQVESLTVDDFNDMNLRANLGGEWNTEDDSSAGGNSSAIIKLVRGRNKGGGALRLDYVLGPRYEYRFSAFTLTFPEVRDWSGYKGIRFWIRGSGKKMRIELATEPVKDWDFHSYHINKTPAEWTEYFIPFSDFKQGGWGKERVELNLALIYKMYFLASSSIDGEEGFIEIDNMSLEKNHNNR